MFRENKEIFNILSEAVSEGVVVVNNQQEIVLVNSSVQEIFGYSKDEIQGKPLSTLIPVNYHSNHKKHASTYMKNGTKRQMGRGRDLYAQHKEGHQFPVEVGLSPISLGEDTFTMALVIDISYRKKQENFKKQQGHVLEMIAKDEPLDNILQDVVKLIESQREGYIASVLEYNQKKNSLHALVTSTLPKVYSNAIEGLIPGLNVGSCGTAVFLKQNVIVKDIATDVRWENYKDLALPHNLRSCWSYPIYSSKNKVLGTFAVYSNEIREPEDSFEELIEVGAKLAGIAIEKNHVDKSLKLAQKRLKEYAFELEKKVINRTKALQKTVEQLQESNNTLKVEIQRRKAAELKALEALKREKELNELKTKFLSMVSHEFKTPLSGILTSAILVEKYKEVEQQSNREKHLNTIKDKIHYLNNILNDFLSIERLDTGKVGYKPTTFLLHGLVNEVIYNANVLLKDGQSINFPEAIEEIEVVHDRKILELILSNILHNAIKYSPENSIIDFSIKPNGESIEFVIIDQGIGIPKDDQKFIFNRYFRAQNALLNQGTGIGLNIVKSHLKNLGGSIIFTSKENKGTTFTITLPKTATI